MEQQDARAGARAAGGLGGEPLQWPGEAAQSKLPLPGPGSGPAAAAAGLDPELRAAWTGYVVQGFRQNEEMFRSTLDAFMKPYLVTVWLYGALAVVGLGLFVAAVVIGLAGGQPVVAIAFAGLSVTAFLAFFLRQPLHALEENLEFITWLGVAFNTYWTRLLYLSDPATVQQDLRTAEQDFRASVEQLITRHAELRGRRPGG